MAKNKYRKTIWIKVRSFVELMEATYRAWTNDKASTSAAALAFYATFSLAPILLVILAVAGGLVGSDVARGQLTGEITSYLGHDGTAFVMRTLDKTRESMTGLTATVIALATSLFGATVLFVELQSALNQVWNVRAKGELNWRYTINIRLISFSVILIMGFLLILSIVFTATISTMTAFLPEKNIVTEWLLRVANFLISFILSSLMFAVVFKVLPDVEIGWRDVAIGAIFTSLLFTVGKMIISLYIAYSSLQSLYGAAGSFVIILAWVYYSAQVFFFGAELCQVWSTRYGSGIKPNRYSELDPCALTRSTSDSKKQKSPQKTGRPLLSV